MLQQKQSDNLRCECFHALISRHGSLIHGFCRRRSSGIEFVFQELVQECHISIFRHLHTLCQDADIKQERAWVIWQCRNTHSHWKRRRRFEWVPIDSQLSDTYPNQQEDVASEYLEELAGHLNERQRHTLALMRQGYSIKEIAEKLNIKSDSVKKQRHRLIEKMRQAHYGIHGQNDESHEHKNHEP